MADSGADIESFKTVNGKNCELYNTAADEMQEIFRRVIHRKIDMRGKNRSDIFNAR